MKPWRRELSIFLLKLEELMRWHLVWAFGDRGGAWFQVDDKLDFSNQGAYREVLLERHLENLATTTGMLSIAIKR